MTYALPVIIVDMALLQGTLDLVLSIRRQRIISINHVHVSVRNALPVVDDLGSDAAPVKASVLHVSDVLDADVPVPVLPALLVLEHHDNTLTELALRDLDALRLAFSGAASSAVVWANFCALSAHVPNDIATECETYQCGTPSR